MRVGHGPVPSYTRAVRVVLNDRTAGLRPELKEYAQRKLERLARHFGRVADAEVDFVDNVTGGGFTIKNPNAKSTCGCGSSFSV